MSYTVANLLAEAYLAMGRITHYLADSDGSTTEVTNDSTGIQDANLKGAIFVIDTVTGNAPKGEYQQLSKFTYSTGLFAVASAFTAAIKEGDVFGFVSSLYPTSQMIAAINAGLNKLGDISLVDTTTLTTESSKTEYTAELVWKRKEPILIEWQGATADSDDNDWQRVDRWKFVPATAGEKGKIEFAEQLPDGRALRIWYEDRHPLVNSYDDVISATVPEPMAVAATVEMATRWQSGRSNMRNKGALASWNESKGELENVRRRHRIHKTKRKSKTNAMPRSIRRR